MINTESPKNFDWGEYSFSENVQVLDTSLRDGLQDSEIRHPTLNEKRELIQQMPLIGVNAVDIAIPIARGSHLRDAIQLARELPSNIDIVCLARTQEEDIKAAVELAQGAGRPVEAIIFVGASPIRRWVEGWELDEMIGWMRKSVKLASDEGLIPNIATEHTTEAEPEVLEMIYRAGLESGGRKVCIADTTGAATPMSVERLIHFFQKEIINDFDSIDIDWHGHDDRGGAVTNSLAALQAGARRVHGTVLGIGERAGNTPIETLLINLKIAGDPARQDLTSLDAFSKLGSRIFNVPIRANYPGIGEKVGKTASGIHAAAMVKARNLGIDASLPYSRVDQRWFGKEADVRIGPLSGRANVEWVTQKLGLECTQTLVDKALKFARDTNRILSNADIINIASSLENESNGN